MRIWFGFSIMAEQYQKRVVWSRCYESVIFCRSTGQGPRPLKGASNNYQFVTPAPYQVRGKLRRESIDVNPAKGGTGFLLSQE
ncbi:MAG: hypothetical protein A2V86_02285 [Deltaproteobacteria bacterium RBG_16_49_23]|nr:MAG: hypothetical protein A2V86_02285 [Deltaproteobacteria bacterium RBG_16_49_23]